MTPLEKYLQHVYQIRSTGGGVEEETYYPALANLFNEIGKALKPAVLFQTELKDAGAGKPDGGFFSAEQFEKKKGHRLKEGQTIPLRGAVEVKPPSDDAARIASSQQVTRYLARYR